MASSAPVPTNLHSHASSVPLLNGTNFSEWRENVEFTLGVLDLDLALTSEKPPELNDKSTKEDKELHKLWEKNKSVAGNLMAQLTTMKFDGTRSMYDHVTEMQNISTKLNDLGISVTETFLVTFILNSLPEQYAPFQMHYNTHEANWTVDGLRNQLDTEEKRLARRGITVAHLTTQGAHHKFGKKAGRGQKRAPHKMNDNIQPSQQKAKKDEKCRFCKKPGHFQKDCPKRREWFEKKGNPLGFGFLTTQIIDPTENFLTMGNGDKVPVEAIGTYRLVLVTGHSKTTKHTKKGAKRSSQLLEIIHTDICGPFDVPTFGGENYFITFIDDYSRYCYLYLLHNKSQSVNAVEAFIMEVERRLEKKVKIIRVPSKAVPKTPFELWKGWKPSLKHLQVWGCAVEARAYNPDERKLDMKTISGYFIGFPKKSKGYIVYCPNHKLRIIETGNVKFIMDGVISGSTFVEDKSVHETRVTIPLPIKNADKATPSIVEPHNDEGSLVDSIIVESTNNEEPQHQPQSHDEIIANEEIVEQPALRRSVRERRNAISKDYVCYLQESDFDIGIMKDPVSYSQAIASDNSEKWIDAMNDELKSMADNQVWDLTQLSDGHKAVANKWIFKTKRDCNGNVERYKARLVAKGFTQKDGIDYKETFSPVSKKDSLRIIMALVAHYDLELHQMDVKTAFLNGELQEEVYMSQPEGYTLKGQEDKVCKLKKSINGLKQASRQWYLKFNETINAFGFEENVVDPCIYLKISGRKFIFLVLYVDDILLASSDLGLLHETKVYLSKNFEMKDMGEASYVIGIEISRDRSRGLLGLSQKAYIERVLERFVMATCSASVAPVGPKMSYDSEQTAITEFRLQITSMLRAGSTAPIQKGDKFGLYQCPKNELERKQMEKIPYASLVGSLMYAQGCTRPDISFAVGMLGRYQVNPGMDHWRAAKKVLRYLQGTKDLCLTYRKSEQLELVGYSDSDYAKCVDTMKSTFGYIFLLAGAAVSWKSVKQSIITNSTMEAEFVACHEAMNHCLWLRNFISRFGDLNFVSGPLNLYCDNKAAVFFSKHDRYSKGTKHMDLKYLLVKQAIQKEQLFITHISTSLMIADGLTKGLPPKTFQQHVPSMGLVRITDY
ncbi:hypothetical protein OSB04_005166 [Centaurea solstitialis]|uniref:CCHC-type domain-containing protein n=1 Tax=Centaurea solstitialis TaxID=347529 RepID=A0AA38TR25_9ASTR|nr:hypothetical protein OSB04_005166 [Centaurea solstitialis]